MGGTLQINDRAAMASAQLVSRLDELLAQRGMSGRELAEAAGITEVTVTKLRRNRFQSIDKEVAARVCLALEASPGDLFTIENENHSQNE